MKTSAIQHMAARQEAASLQAFGVRSQVVVAYDVSGPLREIEVKAFSGAARGPPLRLA